MPVEITGTLAYQHYNSFTEDVHTLSVTVPADAEALLIGAACNNYNWNQLSSIAVNGSALTLTGAASTPADQASRSCRYWLLLDPPPGTYNVVMVYTTSSGNAGLIFAAPLKNVDSGAPIADSDVVSVGAATSPSSIGVSTPTGGMAFSIAYADGAQPATGAGQTTIGVDEQNHSASYRSDAAAMAVTFTGTPQLAHLVIVIAPGSSDPTAPVLSSPVGTATGATTATVGATTDEGNGTLYAVVTTSPTQPSDVQIKAGQDHTGAALAAGRKPTLTVSSAGAKTMAATGLAASTTYYAHLVHADSAGNNSNRVSSASFTTAGLAGFDFDTGVDQAFGDLAGALVALSRVAGAAIAVAAFEVDETSVPGEVHIGPFVTSTVLTTNSNGNLPRWENEAFVDATEYFLVFVRQSDGAACADRMAAT